VATTRYQQDLPFTRMMLCASKRHLAEIRFTDLPARLPTLALASKSTIETRKPPLWDDGDAQVDDGVQ
jgi:hypothetical protein